MRHIVRVQPLKQQDIYLPNFSKITSDETLYQHEGYSFLSQAQTPRRPTDMRNAMQRPRGIAT